jgi:hypothetical protein
MARHNGRSPEDVRRDIASEREQLAGAVTQLKTEIGETTDVAARIRSKLPLAAVGALGAGFVLAGGIGATMRFLARRGREGNVKAKLGPYAVIDRR